MQVQLVKANGQTDTLFNVKEVEADSLNNLYVTVVTNGKEHTLGFMNYEWTNFITSK